MDLEELRRNYQPIEIGRVSQKPKKPRWTAWLSEIGGGGGALGGAAIGTAVLPGLGTLIGGGLGGLFGGFAGKTAEQRIRDPEESIGTSLRKAAIEGGIEGIFGAGPLRLSKIAVQGTKAALKGAGKQGVKEVAHEIATKPGYIANRTKGLLSRVGRGAENVANDAALKNFKINDPNWITKFAERVGEDPGEFARRLGFAVDSPANIGTKYYEPLQEVYESALDKIPAISKNTITKEFKEVYEPLIKSYARKDLGAKLRDRATSLLKDLPENLDAHDVRAIKTEFQDLVDQSLTDKAGRLENNINKQIADVFRRVLNKSADEAGIVFTPGKLPIKGAKATNLMELGNELRGIKEFADKAKVKVNVGRGRNPIGLSTLIGGAGGGGLVGGPAGMVAGASIPIVANSSAGRKAEFKAASLLSRVFNRGAKETARQGTKPSVPTPSRLGMLGRVMAGSAVSDLVPGQSSPLDPNMSDNTQMQAPAINTPNTANMDSSSDLGGNMSIPQSPFQDLNWVQQNYISAIRAGDLQSAAAILKGYEMFGAPAAESKGLNSTASQIIAETETGLAALGDLEQEVQTSGANYPLIGRIRGSMPFDTGAQRMKGQIALAKQLVGKALEGGVLRKEDEVKYTKMIPTMGDTDAVALNKIADLRNLINVRLQQYKANLAGGSGGLDINALTGGINASGI